MKPKNKSGSVPMDLSANPRNPRTITTDKLKSLKASLEKYGDLGGIIRNVTTGFLVGGHQRVETFKQCADPVLTITERLPKPDPVGTVAWGYVTVNGTRYAYREVQWDKNTESAAMLAANNPAGEWVKSDLGEILRELKESETDLTILGFDESELTRLMSAVEAPATEMTANFNYSEQYGVIVVCKDADDQKKVYEDLQAKGYDVKVVNT